MNFSLRDDKVVNRIEKRSNGLEKLHLSSVSLLKSDRACVCVSVSVSGKEEMPVKGNILAHGCFPPMTSHYSHLRQKQRCGLSCAVIMKCHKQMWGLVNQPPLPPPPPPHTHPHEQASVETGNTFLKFKFSVCEFWWWNRATSFLDVVLFPSWIVKVFSWSRAVFWCNKDVFSLTLEAYQNLFFSWICARKDRQQSTSGTDTRSICWEIRKC